MHQFQKTIFLLFAIAGRKDCHKGGFKDPLQIVATESAEDIKELDEYEGKRIRIRCGAVILV